MTFLNCVSLKAFSIHFLAVSSFLTSPILRFLICEMEIFLLWMVTRLKEASTLKSQQTVQVC